MLRKHFLIGLVLVAPLVGAAAGDLAYRDRGDRHEGIRRQPIGGYDVQLLGAMVEPLPQVSAAFPEKASLRFYLGREEPVHLTVRERHPEESYWLDRAEGPWRPRAANLFSWPRRDVLEPLGLRPAELLVLVRLGDDEPRLDERVAPVLFHPPTSPEKITRYRFTFKTQARARSRHAVYGPGSSEPLQPTTPYSPRSATVPFDVAWDATGRPEGTYRLVLEGYFSADNSPFRQVVEFFHSPVWPG